MAGSISMLLSHSNTVLMTRSAKSHRRGSRLRQASREAHRRGRGRCYTISGPGSSCVGYLREQISPRKSRAWLRVYVSGGRRGVWASKSNEGERVSWAGLVVV